MNFIQLLSALFGRVAPSVEGRKEERIPTHQRAGVSWKDYLGRPKTHSITIVNVSGGGVAFVSPNHLPKSQVITITTSNRSLDCVVRHVRKSGRGYLVGAEVMLVSGGDDKMSAIRDMVEEAGEAGESGDK